MSEPLTTTDWDRLLGELREFAGESNVSDEDGVAHAKTGDGHVELRRGSLPLPGRSPGHRSDSRPPRATEPARSSSEGNV